jgi:hypothetical protein
MKKIVFLLEEVSMKETLSNVLLKITSEDIQFQFITHEGKSDLKKSIARKLRCWNEPDVNFIIVHDKDANDCMKLKGELVELKKLIPAYQQISGSQKISQYMDIEKNKSHSFHVFMSGVRRFCENPDKEPAHA